MNTFYTLLTDAGMNAIVTARAKNTEIKLTKMAVGDGEIVPAQEMSSLLSEKYRFDINSLIQDETNTNQLIVEGVIPSNIGGFNVSEIGIYTQEGVLFAIGNLPKTYKPQLDEGSSKDLTIRVVIEVTNADVVTLQIDDSVVLATKDFVTKELDKHIKDKNNPHSVTKAQIGLGNVDNTSDINKSVLTATKLTIPRTIGGVSFDGTSNINLPGVNTAGNQNTSGNAATATKLQTARRITLAGDVTGYADTDFSSNVTINTTVTGGQVPFNPTYGVGTEIVASPLNNIFINSTTVTRFNAGQNYTFPLDDNLVFKKQIILSAVRINSGGLTFIPSSEPNITGTWKCLKTIAASSIGENENAYSVWDGTVSSIWQRIA